MTREAKAIERRLRRRITPLVRASPALWSEYKTARRENSRSLLIFVCALVLVYPVGPLLFVALPIFAALGCERLGGLDFVAAGFSLWSVGAVLLIADSMVRKIWLSAMPTLLLYLPIADGAIVRNALRKTTVASALWLLLGVHAFAFIAWRQQLPLSGWLSAVPFCLVQWLIVLASGVVLAHYRPTNWYWAVGIFVMLPCVTVEAAFARPAPLAAAQLIADVLYAATPAGWIAACWTRGFLAGSPWGWLGLAPASLLLARFWRLSREWPAQHNAAELPQAISATLEPQEQLTDVRADFTWTLWHRWRCGDWPDDDFAEPDAAAVAERIRSRAFLQPGDVVGTGTSERLFRRLFSPSERSVVEWMAGDWLSAMGMNAWSFAFGIVGGAAMANFILGWRFPCLDLLAYFVLVMMLFDRWRGFRTTGSGENAVPFYATLPVSYGRIARLMFKLTLIQRLDIVPGLIAAALYDHFVLGIAAQWLWARIAVMLTLFMVIATLWPIGELLLSSSLLAMPCRRAHWTIAVYVLGFTLTTLAVLPLVLLGFVANKGGNLQILLQVVAVAGALALPCAFGFSRLCLWLDRRGLFDLVATFSLGMIIPQDIFPQDLRELMGTRRRRVLALRQRFGMFWWLPRYMMKARQEQGL